MPELFRMSLWVSAPALCSPHLHLGPPALPSIPRLEWRGQEKRHPEPLLPSLRPTPPPPSSGLLAESWCFLPGKHSAHLLVCNKGLPRALPIRKRRPMWWSRPWEDLAGPATVRNRLGPPKEPETWSQTGRVTAPLTQGA